MAVCRNLFVLCVINCYLLMAASEFVGSSRMQFVDNKQFHEVVLSQLMEKIESQEVRLKQLEMALLNHEDKAEAKERRISQLETSVSDHETALLEKDQHLMELKTRMKIYEENLVEKDQRITELRSRMAFFEESLRGKDQHKVERENNVSRQKDSVSSFEDENTNIEITYLSTEDPREYDQQEKKMIEHEPSIRVSPIVTQGVAFCVSLSKGATLHVNEVIVYSTVMTDIGRGYNQHDGIYIVPKSGVYVFTWTTVSSLHSNIGTSLIINGSVEGLLGSFGGNINNYQSATGVIVKAVTAGDHVYIKNNMNGAIVSDGLIA
ncbi:uncharacterized protein LOC132548425 [Ylistrum balloti]|uniref:uncharacterized protein LOC132548425 n=1 Tax=Ylistrum balloti TaxID=509963 RepID=UPI00290587FC|nr:uncharacterized protein LOC132548425 [Ylistrum balloti]